MTHDYHRAAEAQREEPKPSEMGTDASAWAREFCKRWPSALCQIPGHEGIQDGDDFEATVLGWFANAIETAKDAAWNQRAKPVVKALEWEVYCSRSGNRSAMSVFGEYVCERLDDDKIGIWLPCSAPNDEEYATKPDFDEAEKFVQADFTCRVHAFLGGYDD